MVMLLNIEEKIKEIVDNEYIKGHYYDGFCHGIEIRGEPKTICKIMAEVSELEEVKKISFTRFKSVARLKIEY